jgi:hypothetical protein
MKAAVLAIDLAVFFGLLYAWLAYPERSVAHFALSVLLALAALAAGAFYFSGAFAHGTWGDALRRLPRSLAVFVVMGGVAGVVLHYVPQPQIAWGLIALAVLTSLPFFYAAAGSLPLVRGLRSAPLWAAGIGWMAAAFVVPYLLLLWVPRFESLTVQTASFILRLALGLAAAVGATLALARFVHAQPARPSSPPAPEAQ